VFCLSAGLVLYQGNIYFLTFKFWAEIEIVKDRGVTSALTAHGTEAAFSRDREI
jgi:hypothetical protein